MTVVDGSFADNAVNLIFKHMKKFLNKFNILICINIKIFADPDKIGMPF